VEIPRLFFVDRRERGRIKVTGKERQTFLQGMVTNDVARLTPGQGCYAFMLDATAHVLADMRIIVRENDLLLDVEPGKAPFVMETLDKYLIMEKARFTDVTLDTAQFLLGGSELAWILQTWGLTLPDNVEGVRYSAHDARNRPELTLPDDVEGANTVCKVDGMEITIARSHWMGIPTYDLYVAVEWSKAIWEALEEEEPLILWESDVDASRIKAGIPRFGVDIDSRVLAPETGQVERAISYKKGCYIGQEIVARIDARGRTNRGFTQFLIEPGTPLPEPETPILVDGKDAGRVTSATPGFVLGYLRHEHSAPGTFVTMNGQGAIVADKPV